MAIQAIQAAGYIQAAWYFRLDPGPPGRPVENTARVAVAVNVIVEHFVWYNIHIIYTQTSISINRSTYGTLRKEDI